MVVDVGVEAGRGELDLGRLVRVTRGELQPQLELVTWKINVGLFSSGYLWSFQWQEFKVEVGIVNLPAARPVSQRGMQIW